LLNKSIPAEGFIHIAVQFCRGIIGWNLGLPNSPDSNDEAARFTAGQFAGKRRLAIGIDRVSPRLLPTDTPPTISGTNLFRQKGKEGLDDYSSSPHPAPNGLSGV
jgi:hypothetical protein